jgi:hypothetical protein
MRTPIIKATSFLMLICIFLYSCDDKTRSNSITDKTIDDKKDSIDNGMPQFLNTLNIPEMDLPAIGHFSSADILDTLDFEVKESEEYLYDFILFTKGDKKNSLNITIASDFHVYDEGDLDGDGTNEIGILPGYNTSACRNYGIYSFANHKWKLLYTVSSHLPDREQGVDYVKRQGDTIRILSADFGCCQCFGLDTTYINLNNKNPFK